tara:strand:+ start:77 stop:307 length:231 start_codon:yes stop_codon:yes gene_type:complete
MSDNYIQVEGYPDLVRDKNSHAIINRNRSAYDQAKKRAKEAQEARDEIRDATRQINNIKSEIHEIKHLIQQLVSKE